MQHLYKKRKGFTLTELAIVIAVIAILIAVLVPTFVSLINSANNSSDEQTVKNMNTSLQLYEAENDQPEALCVVWDILEEDGYSAQPTPNYSDNEFYWYKTDNRILIYSKSEEQFTFPAEYEGVTISTVESSVTHKTAATTVNGTIYQGNVIALNTAKTDSSAHDADAETTGKCSCCGDTIAVIVDSTNIAERLTTVEDYGTIQLTGDVDLSELSVDFKTVSIDLNGYTLTTSQLKFIYEESYYENEGADKDIEILVENGTIKQTEEATDCLLFVRYGAVTLSNVEIIANDSEYAIYNVNNEEGTGTLTINDCDVTGIIFTESDSTTVINGGTFTANSGDKYIIYNYGTLTVNGGTFCVGDLPSGTDNITYTLIISDGPNKNNNAVTYEYTAEYQFAIVQIGYCTISNSVKFIYSNDTETKELSTVNDYYKVLYNATTSDKGRIFIVNSTGSKVYNILGVSDNTYFE